ncbi:ATP-binding cassette domain-containing protein [Fructilactobacillus vespulae]|uniref:ATP-binding cassette domain-containing protein n=1 Tax=Fructilactobacillus vespulae TaxID=1249630 RepID=UPI0039B5BA25
MDNKIVLDQVNYTYAKDTPFAHQALKGLDLTINAGEFVSIIGKTGSGKSTLVRLLNGLLIADEGRVSVNNLTLKKKMKKAEILQLRSQVGMIFQSAEKQLFADSVIEDVSFGPQNFGVPREKAIEQAKQVLKQVGIPAELFNRSPFELSGGQMRRVAIAGVLVMNPTILILDEPTVGLDEIGRREILEIIQALNEQKKVTIVMITHNMNVVSEYAKRVIWLSDGQLKLDLLTRDFFATVSETEILPPAVRIYRKLQKAGYDLESLPLTKTELVTEIMKKVGQ